MKGLLPGTPVPGKEKVPIRYYTVTRRAIHKPWYRQHSYVEVGRFIQRPPASEVTVITWRCACGGEARTLHPGLWPGEDEEP